MRKFNLNKIILKIKRVCVAVGILSGLFFAIYLFVQIQKCGDSPQITQVDENEYLIQKKEYRLPVLDMKIPFVKKAKQPVADKDLPIPKKKIAKTIVVELPKGNDLNPSKVTLVIDKKGKIYRSKDTPKDVKIVVTEWKPKLINIGFSLGYTFVYKGKFYHCLSLDVLKIGRFHAGGEGGIHIANSSHKGSWLLGLSGKYHFASFDFIGGLNITTSAVVGWDFISKGIYGGVNLKF